MKKYGTNLLLGLGLWYGVLLPLQANGLELEVRIESEQPEATDMAVVTKIQDGKMRTDAGQVSTIVDTRSGEVISLLHPQRMFMKMPGAALQQVMAMLPQGDEEAGGAEEWKLEPTGRKEIISGWQCEEYAVSGRKMQLWLTRDISPELAPVLALRDSALFGEVAKGWPKEVASWPGFPVRVVSNEPGEAWRVTILRAEEKPIDASEFVPPPNYQTMQLPPGFEEMLQQMPR
jgi:hypothetical protein